MTTEGSGTHLLRQPSLAKTSQAFQMRQDSYALITRERQAATLNDPALSTTAGDTSFIQNPREPHLTTRPASNLTPVRGNWYG